MCKAKKVVLDIQMKLMCVSLLKGDIQLLNQKSDLDNFFLKDSQKRYFEILKDFMRSEDKCLLTACTKEVY